MGHSLRILNIASILSVLSCQQTQAERTNLQVVHQEEMTLNPETASIIVASINAYAFPEAKAKLLRPLKNLHPRAKINVKERTQKLAEYLLSKANPSPDIIFFQELWGIDHKQRVRKILEKTYPNAFLDTSNGSRLIGLDSGLMIVSKKPFKFYKTHRYHYKFKGKNPREEKWAQKGALLAKVRITPTLHPDAKFLYLVNTHLTTGGKKAKQVNELAKTLKNFIDETENMTQFYSVIIGGDLNSSIAPITQKNAMDTKWKPEKKMQIFLDVFADHKLKLGFNQTLLHLKKLPSHIKGTSWKNSGVIDHFLTTADVLFTKYQIDRTVQGGDEDHPSNSKTALTDHAMVVISTKIPFPYLEP